MSIGQGKMIFTTGIVFHFLLFETLVMAIANQERPYTATIAPSQYELTSPSQIVNKNYHNLRLYKVPSNNYDSSETMTSEDASIYNQGTQSWQSSPRKPYRTYYNSHEPLAAASSQYTNIYRNRNLFSKPNWNSPSKSDTVDSVQHSGSSNVYYPSGRNYESQAFHKQELTTKTATMEFLKTTAEPRTAPATDVITVTERPTTTHEMPTKPTESDYEDIYHTRGNWDNTKSPNRYIVRSSEVTDHYTDATESKQERQTHYPDDEADRIIFPTTPIFGGSKEYLRPTHDDDVVTVKPLKPKDFAELMELIDARKKTDVENRNSPLVNYNHSIHFRPPVCKDPNGYCTESKDYPKDALNSILKNSLNSAVFQTIFGDSLDNNSIETVAQDLTISGRIDLPQEVPLCASVEHTIYPKVAKNKEGKDMFVVNHDEYIQGIRVEKCLGENGGCQFNDGSPTGYQTFCRQKYIYKKLLAFNDGKALTTDSFRLPSCCVCYIKSSLIADRIQLDTSPMDSLGHKKKFNSQRTTTTTRSAPPKGSSSSSTSSVNDNSNVHNSNYNDDVATELPGSEFDVERTDKVEINNSTAIFNNNDNVHSDNSSSTSSSKSNTTTPLSKATVARWGTSYSF